MRVRYNDQVGSRTGRPLPASSGARRGKSELRRAVCRITSGRVAHPFAAFAKGWEIRRKVPQKTYRLGGNARVRVKRCGKSAPPRQQCRGQGKPHTEQDQIGRNPVVAVSFEAQVATAALGCQERGSAAHSSERRRERAGSVRQTSG